MTFKEVIEQDDYNYDYYYQTQYTILKSRGAGAPDDRRAEAVGLPGVRRRRRAGEEVVQRHGSRQAARVGWVDGPVLGRAAEGQRAGRGRDRRGSRASSTRSSAA